MYAAESTASSRLLPASSVDITMDLVLWPTPAAGLFGLETSIRCARENTLCALLQDVRARLETRPSQISRPPPRQRPYVAAREHVPTVQAALKDFVKAMHEFDAKFSDANSIAVGRATLTWARRKMTQTAVTRVGSLAEFDADVRDSWGEPEGRDCVPYSMQPVRRSRAAAEEGGCSRCGVVVRVGRRGCVDGQGEGRRMSMAGSGISECREGEQSRWRRLLPGNCSMRRSMGRSYVCVCSAVNFVHCGPATVVVAEIIF